MGNSVRTSSLGLFGNVSENFESCVKQNVVGNVTFWISIIDPVLNGLECWNPLRVGGDGAFSKRTRKFPLLR